MSIEKHTKNLIYKKSSCIYYCLYGDIRYKEILHLSVLSLNKFFPKEDIFVFSEYDIPEFNQYCNLITVEFPQGYAKPMAYRLILGKILLQKYDNVLHLDADTLVFDNVDNIFSCFEDNKISFATETPNNPDKIIDQYWAGPLLDEEDKIKYSNVDSLCCGVFGFNGSMYENLEDIYNFICECEDSGFSAICRDQHGFTTYVLKNNMYNYNLQKYVEHFPKEESTGFKIYHFAGGVCSGNKYDIMKKFLKLF